MSLVCPSCGAPSLKIVGSVERGPNANWDERTIQRARCECCGEKFLCTYSERRSFNPDRDDIAKHIAYPCSWHSWHLARLIFTRPERRISVVWRIRLADKLLNASMRDGTSHAITLARDQ